MDLPDRMSKGKRHASELRVHAFRTRSSSVFHFAFCVLMFFVVGCQNGDEREALVVQIEELTLEKAQLQEQIDKAEGENAKLKEQLQTLSGLPADVRLDTATR